jgi:hypothetical protein
MLNTFKLNLLKLNLSRVGLIYMIDNSLIFSSHSEKFVFERVGTEKKNMDVARKIINK